MSFEVKLVNSAFVALVAYDEASKTLRVITYNNSTVMGYDYLHVPRRVFDSLSTASSVGVVFNTIKNEYNHVRLDSTVAFRFYSDSIRATATTRILVD